MTWSLTGEWSCPRVNECLALNFSFCCCCVLFCHKYETTLGFDLIRAFIFIITWNYYSISSSYAVTFSHASWCCFLKESIYIRSLFPFSACFFFFFFLPMHSEQTLQKVTALYKICVFFCEKIVVSNHFLVLAILFCYVTFNYLFHFAVTALRSVKRSLVDPKDYLRNWNRGDPCRSNWTGVICSSEIGTDEYLHVRELYVFFIFLSTLVCLYICCS